jgi:arginase family enzyme
MQHLLKTHAFFGVSLDIDGIDPAYCPATGTSADGGLELEDIVQSLQGILFNPSCIGLEITEYNPNLDHDQITFESVKKIIKSLVG